MIPKRTISATCEISTGTLILDNMAPTFVGENYATMIEVALKNGGTDYSPSGCIANMYLYWPGTPNMTGAVEMDIVGSTLSGEMTEDMTLMSGCPLLVIQLLDENAGDLIVAAASPIQIINVRGSVIISGRAPSPSEIVYIGRAPYIGNDGHWYQWNSETHEYQDTEVYAAARSPYISAVTGCWMVWNSSAEQYVDSGVVARGMPALFTASATTLSPGSAATASITGTAENPVLNLGIPRGADSAVQTVCGVSPDGTGNVPVQDSNIPCAEVTGQTTVEGAIASLNSQIAKLEVLKVELPSPITFGSAYTSSTDSAIADVEDDMVVLHYVLGTPSAQTADWTVTTGTGSVTITGQSGTAATTLTLYLMKSR